MALMEDHMKYIRELRATRSAATCHLCFEHTYMTPVDSEDPVPVYTLMYDPVTVEEIHEKCWITAMSHYSTEERLLALEKLIGDMRYSARQPHSHVELVRF